MSIYVTGSQIKPEAGPPIEVDPASVDQIMRLVVGQRLLVVMNGQPARVTAVTLTPDAGGRDFVVLQAEFLPE